MKTFVPPFNHFEGRDVTKQLEVERLPAAITFPVAGVLCFLVHILRCMSAVLCAHQGPQMTLARCPTCPRAAASRTAGSKPAAARSRSIWSGRKTSNAVRTLTDARAIGAPPLSWARRNQQRSAATISAAWRPFSKPTTQGGRRHPGRRAGLHRTSYSLRWMETKLVYRQIFQLCQRRLRAGVKQSAAPRILVAVVAIVRVDSFLHGGAARKGFRSRAPAPRPC